MAVRSAGTFATILAVGVLIVLIYQWSGDSIIVLIMSLLTLFALLALWDRKPWQVAPDGGEWADEDERNRPNTTGGGSDDQARFTQDSADEIDEGPEGPERFAEPQPAAVRPLTEDSPIWRCRFDVSVDHDGVSGLAIGERETRRWSWDSIIAAGVGWSPAIVEADQVEERVGLHLQLTAAHDPQSSAGQNQNAPGATDGFGEMAGEEVGDAVQLMFGAGQHPGAVLGAIRKGIQSARIQRSRLHSLSPGERTRQLANALSPEPINLTKQVKSPELLYQDARRTLLTSRALRRISRDADAEQILAAIEQLFTAHGALDLDQVEIGPLLTAADRGDSETVYLGANPVAEARGYRLAFITHGGDDHLLGLLPLDDAEDWDGQTVGSGLAIVSLEPPTYH